MFAAKIGSVTELWGSVLRNSVRLPRRLKLPLRIQPTAAERRMWEHKHLPAFVFSNTGTHAFPSESSLPSVPLTSHPTGPPVFAAADIKHLQCALRALNHDALLSLLLTPKELSVRWHLVVFHAASRLSHRGYTETWAACGRT